MTVGVHAMKALCALVLGLLLPLTAYAADDYGINAASGSSIFSGFSDTVDKGPGFHMTVIPLEAFNNAVKCGQFWNNDAPDGDFSITTSAIAARTVASALNDPHVHGVRIPITKKTSLTQLDCTVYCETGVSPIGCVPTRNDFETETAIVVANAQYKPGSTTDIEATNYFVVSGHLYGQSPWVVQLDEYNYSNMRLVVDKTPLGINESLTENANKYWSLFIPSSCCPLANTLNGTSIGYRCVAPGTNQPTVFATPGAGSIAMTPRGHARVYSMPAGYPARGTEPKNYTDLLFTSIENPPGAFAAVDAECLACLRSEASSPAAKTSYTCTPSNNPPPPGHALAECNNNFGCRFGQFCVDQHCVASPLAAQRQCTEDNDCPAKQACGKDSLCHALNATPKPPVAVNHDEPDADAAPLPVPLFAGAPVVDVGGHNDLGMDNNNDGFDFGSAGNNDEEQIDIDLDIDFVGHWSPASPPHEVCPPDNEITVLHCLDLDFMASACGQRFSPGSPAPNYEPRGEQPNKCKNLIRNAIRDLPKRSPYREAPLTQRVCEPGPVEEGESEGGDCAVGGMNMDGSWDFDQGADCLVDDSGFQVEVDLGAGGGHAQYAGNHVQQEEYAMNCHEEPLPFDQGSPNGVYARNFEEFSALYKLDGRPLMERREGFPTYHPFVWDADADFDRSELHATGGTGSQAGQSRVQSGVSQNDAANVRRRIRNRDDRWRGSRGTQQINDCSEYVFQRFYDHSKFMEEAALLGGDDWAIWNLIYGPEDQHASIGTRILSNRFNGPRDFLGNRFSRYGGGRIDHYLPGQSNGHHYFKNIFFSVLIPPFFYEGEFEFPYRNLMRMVQDRSFRLNGHRFDDFRYTHGWRFHRDMGQYFSDYQVPLSAFDHFTTYELPQFLAARNRLHRILADGSGPIAQGERYPYCLHDHCCLSCACYHEKWLLPYPYPNDYADKFFEWRDPGYNWDFAERDRELQAFAASHGIGGGGGCWAVVVDETRNAATAVDKLLGAAELKGYLNLEKPSVADWSPRFFIEEVKGLFVKEKEEAYELCKTYTGDDFGNYTSWFRSVDAAYVRNHAILQNYQTLEASFTEIKRLIEELPDEVKNGTAWEASDSSQVGSNDFGVNLSYHIDVDVGDYVSPEGQPSVGHSSIGFDGGFDVSALAFGHEIPLIEAGLLADYDKGVDVPYLRVVHFDLINFSTDMVSLLDDDDGVHLDPEDYQPDDYDPEVDLPPGTIPEFNFSVDTFEEELVSFQFSQEIPIFAGLSLIITGGVGGSVGAEFSAQFDITLKDFPNYLPEKHFDGTLAPFAQATAFLEGAVSVAHLASVAIRTDIVIVDFSLPVSANLDLINNEDAKLTDLLLSFNVTGTGDLDMLSGNIKARICAGIWPFEYCYRKKIFSWDAVWHDSFTLFDLDLAEPVSIQLVALNRITP